MYTKRYPSKLSMKTKESTSVIPSKIVFSLSHDTLVSQL